MKTIKRNMAVLLAALALVLVTATGARAEIDTAAKQAIIIDAGTGTVLLNKNADEQMPTASMSKTMTVYMVFEALKNGQIKLDDEFLVSEKAWRMGGSRMFIREGTRVKVEDLIRGIIIQSGNDATVAMAEGIAGTEESFVEIMNARAREIGMTNSNFTNASGWPDPNHYSTARDLATLAQRLIADFPDLYGYFAEREFTYNNIKQPNRDPLLGRVPGADGVKTGHTQAAGYGLIGAAVRDGRRVIMVVNGLDSETARREESVRLMEWAFRNFESRTLINAGDAVDNANVWMGKTPSVALIAEKDVTALLPRARRNDFKLATVYDTPLPAPIKKGTVIGKLKIEIPNQPAREINLLAGADVEKKGIFARGYTRVRQLLTGGGE